MNNKLVLIIITMLLLGCLGGCGKQPIEDRRTIDSAASFTDQAGESASEEANASSENLDVTNGGDIMPVDAAGDGNPADGDQLFAGCTLTGTVTEFSSNGCKITPTFQDGNVAYEAAPGYEDESELINVIYDEACSFQIANINVLSGCAAYDSASMEDVKKQTRLIIYGEYDGENNLIADCIYIYRSKEG